MDYGVFNVRTDVNACDCTRGYMDTVRESVLKLECCRKNPLPHRGIEPASATFRSNALPTELHPHPIMTGLAGHCCSHYRLPTEENKIYLKEVNEVLKVNVCMCNSVLTVLWCELSSVNTVMHALSFSLLEIPYTLGVVPSKEINWFGIFTF